LQGVRLALRIQATFWGENLVFFSKTPSLRNQTITNRDLLTKDSEEPEIGFHNNQTTTNRQNVSTFELNQ
jgi:hypothetical protein